MKTDGMKPETDDGSDLSQSSTSKVVHYVRDAIADGELWPNQRLVEADLAVKLGVSRTPVREAIRELTRLGLVRTIRNRGAFVVPTDSKELQEFYAIRGVLEGLAARLATSRVPEAEVDRLEELNGLMREAVDDGDVNLFMSLNDEFHRVLYGYADNNTLYEMIMNLLERTAAMRSKLWRSEQVARLSVEQHTHIVAALRDRDEVAAEKLLRAHIKWTPLVKNRQTVEINSSRKAPQTNSG